MAGDTAANFSETVRQFIGESPLLLAILEKNAPATARLLPQLMALAPEVLANLKDKLELWEQTPLPFFLALAIGGKPERVYLQALNETSLMGDAIPYMLARARAMQGQCLAAVAVAEARIAVVTEACALIDASIDGAAVIREPLNLATEVSLHSAFESNLQNERTRYAAAVKATARGSACEWQDPFAYRLSDGWLLVEFKYPLKPVLIFVPPTHWLCRGERPTVAPRQAVLN
jgi:hypothetical protein